MKDILFFDSTLRDGSHAIRHQLTKDNIETYCKAVDGSGVYTVIVGHGNGLGASSLQVGLSKITDEEMLTTARASLQKTKLGVFVLPGFGTIDGDLAPAIDMGIDLACVASHCTEANVTMQYTEYLVSKGIEVYGVLMMYHMSTKEELLEQAKIIEAYGVRGILLMDSAGASTPTLVRETISYLSEHLSIPVGFHGHNNLGLAVSNSLIAIESGARIIDGTTRGFGAGAGNCQLEALLALLEKEGYETGVNLYQMLDASDDVVTKIMLKPQEIDGTSIVSGLAGVFSGFKPHVLRAAKQYGVDPKDIFMELGKRKVVGGQEDVVVDVAMQLAQRKK